MTPLSSILGQSSVVREILEAFSSRDTPIARLTGPAGSGKTWTALSIGAAWNESGGHAVRAIGDEVRSSRSMHPFLSGLSTVPLNWRDRIRVTSGLTLSLAEKVSGTGGVGATVFDLLRSTLKQKVDRLTRPMNTQERGVFFDLRRMAQRKPVLLIADNAHWWDASSLGLLEYICSAELRREISSLCDIHVLLVDTAAAQRVVAPALFTHFVDAAQNRTWTLRLCTTNEFPAVLESLGLTKPLPSASYDELFAITGGHLKLCEQLIAHFAGTDDPVSPATISATALAHTMVTARLHALGPDGEALSALLHLASVIGSSFSIRELLCLSNCDRVAIERLLHKASDLRLLDLGDRVMFSHDIVWSSLFHHQTTEDRIRAQIKLADCLRVIRPADYETRWSLLASAGEHDKARELLGLALIQRLRSGTESESVIEDSRQCAPDDAALHDLVHEFADAYSFVKQGEYRPALMLMTVPRHDDPMLISGERDYLVALCRLELQTAEGVRESIRILSSWIGQLDSEPELSIRLRMLQQQAYVLAGQLDDARDAERQVLARLHKRSSYDREAAVLMNIQNRRATSVNVPEIAERRVARAIEYFSAGDKTTRHQIELYRSLVNHSSALIKLSRDAEAVDAAKRAEQLVIASPDFPYPRRDVLAHNLTLAEFRAGLISACSAIEQQRSACFGEDGAADNFIQRCNLAALLVLDLGQDEAGSVLDELLVEIRRERITESYLLYYCRAVVTGRLVCQGKFEEALHNHREMNELVNELAWTTAPYARRRHELLEELLADKGALLRGAPEALDQRILKLWPNEVGPCWVHYARILPLCELAFWSDS